MFQVNLVTGKEDDVVVGGEGEEVEACPQGRSSHGGLREEQLGYAVGAAERQDRQQPGPRPTATTYPPTPPHQPQGHTACTHPHRHGYTHQKSDTHQSRSNSKVVGTVTEQL